MNKLRGLQYILKQSMVNLLRNWYMLLASVFVLFASLFIMGSLGLVSQNVQHNLEEQAKHPELEIHCRASWTEEACMMVEKTILQDNRIRSCTRVSRSENLKALTDWLEEIGKGDLEYPSEDSEYTHVSFKVRLKKAADLDPFTEDMYRTEGVQEVVHNGTVIDYFTSIRSWVSTGTYVGLVVLGFLSVLLMLNTIRLTVLARKKELKIMKYVGASQAYMRGPFIAEGFVIGLIGSLLAFFAVQGVYVYLCGRLAKSSYSSLLTLIPFSDLAWPLLGMFVLGGVVTGFFASMLAIKKYIKV